MNTTLVPVTPLRIENAHGNVTLPLESPTFVGDLNRQRCNDSELELYIQSLTPKVKIFPIHLRSYQWSEPRMQPLAQRIESAN